MRALLKNLCFSAVVVSFTFGCVSQQTETVKLYEDMSRLPKTYERLLVIDISTDREMQIRFENEIISGLSRVGVKGIQGHHSFESGDGILQDDINRLSDELGTDGILITHIASIDTTIEREEGHEDVLSTCRGGNPVDFFLYDHEVLSEPETIKVAHTVIVITNLYDSESHKRIWSIQSTCFDKASIAETLLEETKAIIRQLQIDKLI